MRLLEFNEFRKEIELNELANIIANKYDYKNCSYLKSGGEGAAYQVSDKIIMKITNSRLEAKTAEMLNTYLYQYIANI